MITKFNLFESTNTIEDDPKVGEYVLYINTDIPNSSIETRIGQITKIIEGQYPTLLPTKTTLTHTS